MMRYLPANGTAGLARLDERTDSRSPCPPAITTATTLRMLSLSYGNRHHYREFQVEDLFHVSGSTSFRVERGAASEIEHERAPAEGLGTVPFGRVRIEALADARPVEHLHGASGQLGSSLRITVRPKRLDQEPVRIDPGRPAPDQPAAEVRLEARLAGGHRWQPVRQPELGLVQKVVRDQPADHPA